MQQSRAIAGTLATCACGRPATKPRAHATRALDRCKRCRGLARRSAYKGRQRVGVPLVRPMLDTFGRGNPFDLKAALPVAACFGFGRRALRRWLLELVEEDGTVTRSGSGTSALYAFDVAPGPAGPQGAAGTTGSQGPEASPRTGPEATAVPPTDEPPLDADPPAFAAPRSAGTARALDTPSLLEKARAQRGRGAVGAAGGGDVRRGGRSKRSWTGCSGDLVDRLLPVLLDHREQVTGARNLVDELDLDPELGAELGADAVPVSVPLVLYAVSVTEPETRRAAYDADAEAFADRMAAEGSAGMLLVKDVRKPARLPRGLPPGFREVLRVATGGAPHGYGWVLREAGAEEAISRAWIQTAHAHSGCQKVTPVTGWKAFAESGDPDAREGRRGTFRENLARVVNYAFKMWPAEYGSRDLARDIVARGVFEDLWAGALADVSAGASRGGAEREATAGVRGRANRCPSPSSGGAGGSTPCRPSSPSSSR